jgi:hypothetical protein
VLTSKQGYIKLDDKGFHCQYTIKDHVGIWIKEALTADPNGIIDGA